MKVIFLDVDGVLNDASTECTGPSGCVGVDPEKVKLLRQIVEKTGAEIVLTSTWKAEWSRHEDMRTPDAQYLDRMLAEEGLRIFDKTRDMIRDRGGGIVRWLAECPDVESWVVLDDEVFSDFAVYDIMPRLVKTHGWWGLTVEHVGRACELLSERKVAENEQL